MTHVTANARELQFAAGGQMLLDLPQISLSPGLTVLSGASGSGKSTLLYLLSGLLVPTKGAVLWGEADLARMSETARDRWRRRHAGFVFQDFHLIEELSPLKNVLLPATFAGFSTARHRARAEALLQDMGVPARARVSLLSRGEQQRVALARALIFDPQVIFADEPTASLDAPTGARVARMLADLADEGRTVIVASHDPAVLDLSAQRIRLDHGRIAA